jgi:DNA-binding GntR family transcriptional regulator
VLDELRRSIVAGHYEPGDRLYETEIATALNVSRNPVREALQALAGEGYVELEPRRGARVATISRQRADELFEVRAGLEALVARLAARRRSDEQLRQLRELVRIGTERVEQRALSELPDLNTQFHRQLAAAAGNGMLAEMIGRLSDVVHWIYASRIVARSVYSWREHAAIVDAIAAADEEAAREAALVHIDNARRAYLDSAPPPDPVASDGVGRAAVDPDDGAGHEAGARRAQEDHDVGELVGGSQAAQGDGGEVIGPHGRR